MRKQQGAAHALVLGRTAAFDCDTGRTATPQTVLTDAAKRVGSRCCSLEVHSDGTVTGS